MFSGSSTLTFVTISSGSTVTAQNNSINTIQVGIINNGTLKLNSGGNFTDLVINGSLPLDLSGTGVLAMSNFTANRIYGNTGTETLINGAQHTIEGAGQLGVGRMTFFNNGVVLANQSNALTIAPNALGAINNGTFQANSGSLLFMNGTLSNYNPTTSTLTGGTYNAYSGTIELSQANATSSLVIATNAATILLDGISAKIADGSGNDILQGFFTTNAAAGNFTIQNGRNLTSAASIDFANNAGTMTIGANSTFTVGGSHNFFNGGTVQGVGTIVAAHLFNSGTVMPGASGVAGVLSITGNYADPPSSHLFIQIGGPDTLHGLSQLSVGGTANLNNGTLDVSLINGFQPSSGELFVILTSSGLTGTFNDNVIHDGNVTFTVEYSPPGFANDVVLDASVLGNVPEPASFVLLALGLAGMGTYTARKRRG